MTRQIDREIFSDEFIVTLPIEFRYLWHGLILHADTQGRLPDQPRRIAALVFPGPHDDYIDGEVIDTAFRIFAEHQKIIRYTAGTNGTGRNLIQIMNWWKHQDKARWVAFSDFPPPPGWIDRLCTHVKDNKIFIANMDSPGLVTDKKEYARRRKQYLAEVKRHGSRNVAATKSQASRDAKDDDDIKHEDDGEGDKSAPPLFYKSGGSRK